MNSRIKFFALIILIFIPINKLSCQNNLRLYRGFIINKSGDTINGFISSEFDNRPGFSCPFKPTRSDFLTYFSPLELKGFGSYTDNKFFTTASIHLGMRDTLGFIRILSEGTYDLLYYELFGAKHFLIRGPDSAIHDIEYPSPLTNKEYLVGMTSNKKYILEIDSLLPHTPKQKGYSKVVKPKVSSFVNYFKSYYEASGEPYIIYKGVNRDFFAGFVTGVTYDWYYLKTKNKGSQSYSEPSPYAGISLLLMNKNEMYGLLFQSTLGYEKRHYSYVTYNLTSKDYYETFIKSLASTSRIGFSVNPFQNTSFEPFIEGGGLFSVYLDPKYDNYRDQLFTFNNTAYSFYDQKKPNSLSFYGAFFRTGLQMNLKNKNLLRFSGGYDFLTNSDTYIHSFDFSIIYMMKF